MTVRTADDDAVTLDEAFTAAMQGPAKPREAAPPPPVDRDAPHGRDADGKPLAPYGLTKEGRPKRTTGGRPLKDAAARVTDVAVKPDAKNKPAADKTADYSGPLAELHDAIWLGLSGLSKLGPRIPVIGKKLPEDKLAAEAYVWHHHKSRVCGAVALAAKHNAGAARFCQKIGTGEGTWVLMAGAMLMPVFVHTAAVLGGDDRLKEMDMPSLAELKTSNDTAMEAALAEVMQAVAEAGEAGMEAAAA